MTVPNQTNNIVSHGLTYFTVSEPLANKNAKPKDTVAASNNASSVSSSETVAITNCANHQLLKQTSQRQDLLNQAQLYHSKAAIYLKIADYSAAVQSAALAQSAAASHLAATAQLAATHSMAHPSEALYYNTMVQGAAAAHLIAAVSTEAAIYSLVTEKSNLSNQAESTPLLASVHTPELANTAAIQVAPKSLELAYTMTSHSATASHFASIAQSATATISSSVALSQKAALSRMSAVSQASVYSFTSALSEAMAQNC